MTGDWRRSAENGADDGDSAVTTTTVPVELQPLARQLQAEAASLARTYPAKPLAASLPSTGDSIRGVRVLTWLKTAGLVSAVAASLVVAATWWQMRGDANYGVAQRASHPSNPEPTNEKGTEVAGQLDRVGDVHQIEFVLQASSPELEAMLDLMDESQLQQVSF